MEKALADLPAAIAGEVGGEPCQNGVPQCGCGSDGCDAVCGSDDGCDGDVAGDLGEGEVETTAEHNRARKRKGEELAFNDFLASGGGQRVRKSKIASFRDTLGEAIGSQGGVHDMVAVLRKALSTDEWQQFMRIIAEEHRAKEEKDSPWEAWMSVGKHCVNILQGAATTRWRWPTFVLASAFKRAGWTSRAEILRNFDVKISRKSWAAGGTDELEAPRQPNDNGRFGWRKFNSDRLREILASHSTESCWTGKHRGEVGAESVYEVKSLTSRPTAIYKVEDELCAAVSDRTARRNIKDDHEDFRVTQRKLDCCEKCLSWDTRVERMMRKTLLDIDSQLCSLQADYWGRWCEGQRCRPSDSNFKVTENELKSLNQYIQKHKTWDKRTRAQRGPFHEAEAAASKELHLSWSAVEGCGPDSRDSMIDVAGWYGWHFTCRDNQKAQYNSKVLYFLKTSSMK